MKKQEALNKLVQIADRYLISEPMLIGGIPRDTYLGIAQVEQNDMDITTNGPDISRLAISFADVANKMFKIFDDGHISIYFDDYVFDFSSNYISPDAVTYLNNNLNIYDENLYEVYSRDFTINTLHKKINSNDFYDPTGMAIRDLDKKIIKTVLPPNITLVNDPRRIYRAINFAARFGFRIDNSIVEYVKNNVSLFDYKKNASLSETYITSIISESINKNPDLVIGYLLKMNLFYEIPLVGLFKDELIKRRLILTYLDRK